VIFLQHKTTHLKLKRHSRFNKKTHYKPKQGRVNINKVKYLLYPKHNQVLRRKTTFLKNQHTKNYLYFLKNIKNTPTQLMSSGYFLLKITTICNNFMSYSYSSNVSKLNIYNIFVDINPNNYNFRLYNPSFFITDTVFLKDLVYNPNYYYWGIQNHKLKTKNTTFEKDDKHYYVSKNTTNPTRYSIKSDIFSKNDTTTVFKK